MDWDRLLQDIQEYHRKQAERCRLRALIWAVIGMALLVFATESFSAEFPHGVEYGLYCPMGGDPKQPMHIGYGGATKGHAKMVSNAKQAVGEGRKPNFIVVAMPPTIDGQYEFCGWWLNDRQLPNLMGTLDLWGDLADRWEAKLIVYGGSVFRPITTKLREERCLDYWEMAKWTGDELVAAGVDYVVIDEVSRNVNDGIGLEDNRRRVAINALKKSGVGVCCEAWPHEELYMLHDMPSVMLWDAFIAQHPHVSPHKWGQAPTGSHTGIVLIDHTGKGLDRIDELRDAVCLPAIHWQQWRRIRNDLPPRVVRLN